MPLLRPSDGVVAGLEEVESPNQWRLSISPSPVGGQALRLTVVFPQFSELHVQSIASGQMSLHAEISLCAGINQGNTSARGRGGYLVNVTKSTLGYHVKSCASREFTFDAAVDAGSAHFSASKSPWHRRYVRSPPFRHYGHGPGTHREVDSMRSGSGHRKRSRDILVPLVPATIVLLLRSMKALSSFRAARALR